VFRIRISRGRLLSDRAARTLAGTRIGAGALAAQRQAATMAQTAVGAEVNEALDRHADLAAQVAFDGELGDLLAKLFDLGLGQVLDPGRRVDNGVDTDLPRSRTTDPIDALQADPDVFLDRQVDTRDARHVCVSPKRQLRSELAILT
jgi:hypothetical protein